MKTFACLSLTVVMICSNLAVLGCRGSSTKIVPRRETRSQLALSSSRENVPFEEKIYVTPASDVQAVEGVKITLRHVPREELDAFFANKMMFGDNAGKNPYPVETIVFYVTITNHSGSKVRIQPGDFVMVDDLHTQYQYLNPDGLVDIVDSKGNIYQFAKTTAGAAPGLYGTPIKLAASLAGSGKWRHMLLRQVELNGGYVHNGIIYDGYIAFLRPHQEARNLRILLSNVKMDFDPNDEPRRSLDFVFEFEIDSQPRFVPVSTPATVDDAAAAEPAAVE